MFRKLALTFAVAALATAGAATYKVKLFQPSVVQGKELQPGEYRLEIKENKVLIGKGQQAVEADVKVQSAEKKFDTTLVRYARVGDKMAVQEIRIGGTKTVLLFNE